MKHCIENVYAGYVHVSVGQSPTSVNGWLINFNDIFFSVLLVGFSSHDHKLVHIYFNGFYIKIWTTDGKTNAKSGNSHRFSVLIVSCHVRNVITKFI